MSHESLSQPNAELEQQLAYLARELLGWHQDRDGMWKHVTPNINRWPRLTNLLTGNGMLEIIEAMRDGKAGGWHAHLYVNCDCMAAFSRDDDEYAPDNYITHAQRTGLTLPEAVVRAAYAALQEQAE